jgi:hypothetical protein
MKKLGVRSSELEKLSRLVSQPPASVQLIAQDYDHAALDALASTLPEHGPALGALELSLGFPHHPYNHDLYAYDFAAACPNLETLTVGRCLVNETVLLHPTLRQVTLKHCWLYTPDPLRLGYPDSPASQVAALNLEEVNWGNPDKNHLSQLAFGPGTALHEFAYYGDEDDMEIYPEAITFEGCPHLAKVVIHVCGGWTAKFKGDLPSLSTVGISSQRYGDHRLYFDEIGDGSSAYALRLRDGQGPLAGQQFLFVGQFRHLNLKKARHVITQWGGAVVETASPALTYAVLGEEEYAAYEAGSPSPQVAEVIAQVKQGAATEIIDDDTLRGWIIDNCY